MSLNAATIAVLIEKGMTAADILEVARATEVKADPTNAERQARHRAKKRNGVTVTGAPPNDIRISNPPASSTEPSGSYDEAAPVLRAEHVVEAWNAMAERCGLPPIRKLTAERARKLAGRLRTTSVEDWTEAIGAIERSSFLRGENDRGWRANFDFLLQPASFTKLIEGSYDRSTH